MTNTSTALMVPASGVNKGDHVSFVVCCNISCLGGFPVISYYNLGVMEELIVKTSLCIGRSQAAVARSAV